MKHSCNHWPARAVLALLLVLALQVQADESGEPGSDEPKEEEPGAPKDEEPGEAKSEEPKEAPAGEAEAVGEGSAAEPAPAAEPSPSPGDPVPEPAAEPAGEAAARTGGKPRLLLLDVTPKGVPDTIASSLTDLLDLEFEKGGLYEVMSEEDFRSLLKAEEYKQLTGTDVMEQTEESLAKIAEGANAPFLLRSSLGKVGQAYVLSLDLLDAKQIKVVRRVNQTLVGDPTGLIGSLRTAVLALTLEEKGIAPDISEELIDDLKIAEKNKTMFFSFSPAFELPIGPVRDDSSVAYFVPYFYHLRLDAEMPVYKFLRVFASVSYGTTILQELAMQDKHVSFSLDPATGNPTTQLTEVGVATTTVPYSAMRLPINLGLKIAPETGRFLPYFLAGLGISYQKYSFDDEDLTLRKRPDDPYAATPCQAPYTNDPLAIGSQGQTIDSCVAKFKGHPQGDISSVGLDVVAAAGIEWLLTHNIGLKVELRYSMDYAFKPPEELQAIFVTDQTRITEPGPGGTTVQRDLEIQDTFVVRQIHHGLAFSIGLVAYW